MNDLAGELALDCATAHIELDLEHVAGELNVESDALSRIYAPAPSRVPPHLLELQVRRDRPATPQWKGDRFGPPTDLRVRGGSRPDGAG